jgi:hypothetical protein
MFCKAVHLQRFSQSMPPFIIAALSRFATPKRIQWELLALSCLEG